MRKGIAVASTVAALVLVSSPASAVLTYDEGVSGDLSDTGSTPTVLTLGVGDNLIVGTTGHDTSGAIDRDYFSFVIGGGQSLTAIDVLLGTETLGLSFIGLQEGNEVRVSPNAADAAGLLGWTHFGADDIGTDILDDMSVASAGSTGFSVPLGPGTYSIWLQEISPGGAVPFRLNFVINEVPEPATWMMMLLGFGGVGFAMRRNRRASLIYRKAA